MAAWLAQLSGLFDLDPLIDEYALVPQVSPSLFGVADNEASDAEDAGCLAVEHKLAISIEAALLLYRHAHRALATLNQSADVGEAAAATRAVLLCCADCAGAWACREKLLEVGALEVEAELDFVALLLRTNHKSGETWAYRRHLLALALMSKASAEARIVGVELKLVEELARKYDHHYYAWNHWAWLERFCRTLPQRDSDILGTGPAASAALLVHEAFPKLVHATPSHYGLFHHRVTRLGEQLRHRAPLATLVDQLVTGTCEDRIGASALPGDALAGFLPDAGLEAYAAERRLADSLLSTFPHLEAPWAFRLQLFAAILDAVQEAFAEQDGPSLEAEQCLIDLWRSEMAFAAKIEAAAHKCGPVGESTCNTSARRFRSHALQELAMHLASWKRHSGQNTELCRCAGMEGFRVLAELEAESATAPAVLLGIRADLESLCKGYTSDA